MLIPLIEKDPEANDFTCRDGEIEWLAMLSMAQSVGKRMAQGMEETRAQIGAGTMTLTASGTYPTDNIRIPLESGDKEKANLMLTGEINRVDPATAERLTQAILQKCAESLLDLSTDLRRQGLFILPFRFFTMTMIPDGTLSYPSPQAVALPTDYPPHPEITAFSVTDDALTLAIRFPVRPHRLTITPSDNFPESHSIRTFISYPLYIPDPKEIRGSIGSVRSAIGGNATGIRFAFLSSSAVKASVAAPEKYYEMVGNEKTGYRLSSKMAAIPDYSYYAEIYGYVPVFPRESLLALGSEVDVDTDPMDWIADWENVGDGYLPTALPYIYRSSDADDPSSSEQVQFPAGIDAEAITAMSESLEMPWLLLTRPMALASDSIIRRNAEARAIRRIQVCGLSERPAFGILYCSNDCVHWEAIRAFDPHLDNLVLAPQRLWWRLLLFGEDKFRALALSIKL